MTFQPLDKTHENQRRGSISPLACWITALALIATPAGANIFGAGTMDAATRMTHAANAKGAHMNCDALRRDMRLRNSLKPSERRALIRECIARQQEILIVASPTVVPESPLQP